MNTSVPSSSRTRKRLRPQLTVPSYTTFKETGSRKWTAVASLLPVAMGFFVVLVVAQCWRLVSFWL